MSIATTVNSPSMLGTSSTSSYVHIAKLLFALITLNYPRGFIDLSPSPTEWVLWLIAFNFLRGSKIHLVFHVSLLKQHQVLLQSTLMTSLLVKWIITLWSPPCPSWIGFGILPRHPHLAKFSSNRMVSLQRNHHGKTGRIYATHTTSRTRSIFLRGVLLAIPTWTTVGPKEPLEGPCIWMTTSDSH